MSSLASERESALPDPTGPLVPTGNLRRRLVISRIGTGLAVASALFAVAMLLEIAYTVVSKGAGAISWAFLTQSEQGLGGGGIANAILGTAIIVAIAAAMALPIGVLTGLYLTEFVGARSRSGRLLKLALDLMQGLPTIIVGLVIYGLIVTAEHQQTGFAAALALAIVMLPLIARSSQEVLQVVPNALREAADALGVERWRTVLGVVLPHAAGGILTGAILAVARAAGETAPLLLVDSIYNPASVQLQPIGHGVPNIPIYIYTTYDLPSPSALTLAWGASLVLLTVILVANVAARLLLARSRRKMGL